MQIISCVCATEALEYQEMLAIPKTGGLTMRAIVQHCLPDQHFDCICLTGQDFTSLWVRPTATIAKMFHQLPVERQRAVRCAIGEHVTMDVAAIFDRPSKFFTIVREPVDRVISNFFSIGPRPT